MPVVAALFREYADQIGVDLSYQHFDAELAALPGVYAPPLGALLLAIGADGVPAGCVAVRKTPAPDCCEMKRLHVRPAMRGTGLGRALAMAAIEAATRIGYARMRLDTLPPMMTAQALYRSLGFSVIDAYYETPVAGTIFLELRLAQD